jgi:hypothetical protein
MHFDHENVPFGFRANTPALSCLYSPSGATHDLISGLGGFFMLQSTAFGSFPHAEDLMTVSIA